MSREIKGPEDVEIAMAEMVFESEQRELVGQIIFLSVKAEHDAVEAAYVNRQDYSDDQREMIYKTARDWRDIAEKLKHEK